MLDQLLSWTFCLAKILAYAAVLCVVLFLVAMVVLHYKEGWRKHIFAIGCHRMSDKLPAMKELRKELLKRAKGNILEIGPGPGVNMVCYAPIQNQIECWTGVEPNPYMSSMLDNEKVKHDIQFPTKVYQGFAENMSTIKSGTIDTVVSTHVLCSVTDVSKVLSEISRVLKPTGQFIFFEHVAAPAGTVKHFFQKVISPVWDVLGDGCKFRDVIDDLVSAKRAGLFDHIELEEFNAPINFVPWIKPHIKGVVFKASK